MQNINKINMNIVITMAGFGKRFRDAGYTIPKYKIEVHEKTLFEWSLLSLKGFYGSENIYIFIIREDDNAKEFIKFSCHKLHIENYQIIELTNPTDGQATTALFAHKYWIEEKPLLIYNIDTYVEEGEMGISHFHGDGFIPCFCTEGDHWSFVQIDAKGKAVNVREKERISNNCTLGAYYFKSCALYANLYNTYYADGRLEKGERYVAPLYNELINKGGEVYISIVDTHKVHILGTPEEIKDFEMKKISK